MKEWRILENIVWWHVSVHDIGGLEW